jgi:hypothetical protein
MEQAGKAHAGERSRQDRADRTAHTGENKQVRTTRIRKTGQGKFNHTIGTLLCRKKGFLLVKYKSFYIIAYTYGYSPHVL